MLALNSADGMANGNVEVELPYLGRDLMHLNSQWFTVLKKLYIPRRSCYSSSYRILELQLIKNCLHKISSNQTS